MENVQIILNTERTRCLLYVLMILFIICYLLVWSYTSLKFSTYNCFNYYFKKYLITYVRICKWKEFKILNLSR